MKYRPTRRLATPALLGTVAVLASCSSAPPPSPPAEAPAAIVAPQPAPSAAAQPAEPYRVHASLAANPRAYRHDAAEHLYALNRQRIWKGRLPPMLYAIGTLQVEVDGRGNVHRLHWLRAPRQAPEVIAEIERTVRAAAPFPAPARMGKVVYTDTWLWHKSGQFQLDTLTEGQD